MGRGPHSREVAGLELLKAKLPDDWTIFTNLDLARPRGGAREIDVILIAADRILLIDLKDWHGRIESMNGCWVQNGMDRGRSPVAKILENRRDLELLLKGYLERLARRQGGRSRDVIVPLVQGLVVLTQQPNIDGIAETEREAVHMIDPFLRMIASPKARIDRLGKPRHEVVLTSAEWRKKLGGFFRAGDGAFCHGERQYGPFQALSENSSFRHQTGMFAEYDAEDRVTANAAGLLRLWDFTKADSRFQTEEGRHDIAGREKIVIAALNNLHEEFRTSILQPRVDDHERSVRYWEVFDRSRRLKRLSEFMASEVTRLAREDRLALAQQLIAKVAALHEVDAVHLDIGTHSVWLETPTTVRLSHLFSASIPETKSLGDKRYQFLSSTALPEDIVGQATAKAADKKRRDVFLLGVAVHGLLFGRMPDAPSGLGVLEWDPAVDEEGKFGGLCSWFGRALNFVPEERFPDAQAMLEAFDDAMSDRLLQQAALEGLERFRTIPNQRVLYRDFPEEELLREDNRILMWRSVWNGNPVLVKMWRRTCWGDQSKELVRIHDFLESADGFRRSPPEGVAAIRHVAWVDDAIVLVQDWHGLPNLTDAVALVPERWNSEATVLEFILRLARRVTALHEAGHPHGDLKPENILAPQEGDPEPILIDFFDFTPVDDGEIRTSAYTPPGGGGRDERDIYAVTKIAEELTGAWTSDAGRAVARAVADCRRVGSENLTLLPLIETIDALLHPPKAVARRRLVLGLVEATPGALLPDEGEFCFRFAKDRPTFYIRGAFEEIQIELDWKMKPLRAKRVPLEQGRIAGFSRFEFMKVVMDVEVRGTPAYDWGDLADILNEPDVLEHWGLVAKAAVGTTPRRPSKETDFLDEAAVDGEAAEDELCEEIAGRSAAGAPGTGIDSIDIPTLWRRLMDAEEALTTDGVALGNSIEVRGTQRHAVPFELENGAFDYKKDDRVTVEKYKKGRWVRFGKLDHTVSDAERLMIIPFNQPTGLGGSAVSEGERLRFESHFENQSRNRREAAISRILRRGSVAAGLIDAFNPRSGAEPAKEAVAVDEPQLESRYGLNDDQVEAFRRIVATRPVGLVQGPPGTGKTKFIAALAHYALTSGIAKNVLLASQSHEAVNNAAEAVMKLMGEADEPLRMIRVSQEGAVSKMLLPYHTSRVESAYKDRLKAQFKRRMKIVGRYLGVPDEFTAQLVFLERVVGPLAERFYREQAKPKADGRTPEEALTRLLDKMGAPAEPSAYEDSGALVRSVVARLSARHPQVSEAVVRKIRSAIRLGNDFIGVVSSERRSFETFLAGTRQIVAGTCVGLGRGALGLTQIPFDLVIVDEAARCTASELAVPIQAGRWIVLVGDQSQLEPHHKPEIVSQVSSDLGIGPEEIIMSDFERLFGSRYGAAASHQLSRQYRMLPPIGRIVSQAFYGGSLRHERTTPIVPPDVLPEELGSVVSWLETDSLGTSAFQTEEGTSLVNRKEAELIISLLRAWDDHDPFQQWLANQPEDRHAIGLICTYGAQRDLLDKRVRQAGLTEAMRRNIKVGTVDSYQGKENPIVVLSLTRNNADGAPADGRREVREGFMARANRINVAASRAMDRLVLVGARSRWPKRGPMGLVAAAFERELAIGEASVIDAQDFMEKIRNASKALRRKASVKEPAAGGAP
ncbi:AAA domain-containing protein [Skermanella mucosa]|nr:AAA domain-containing protein [Skermanella mucosa]